MRHIISGLQNHFEASSFMPISASPSDVEKLKNPSIRKPRRLAEDLFGMNLEQNSYHCFLSFRIEDKAKQKEFAKFISDNWS